MVNSMARRGRNIVKNQGVASLAKKLLSYLWNRYIKPRAEVFAIPYVMLQVKTSRPSRGTSPETLLEFAFNTSGGLIRPNQVRSELRELLRLIDNRHLTVVLEIGTERGGMLFLFAHFATSNATIISVDLPRGAFGGGYPVWRIPLYRSFATRGQKVHLIRASSHEAATLAQVKSIIGSNGIDLLFIDGDHSYEGVKADFEMYTPLINTEGILAFHDIAPGSHNSAVRVPQFWETLKSGYDHAEFVANPIGGCGIGVIYPARGRSGLSRNKPKGGER